MAGTSVDAPVVAIEPVPATSLDDLLCRIVMPADDLDGDVLSYEFEWLRNGGDGGTGDSDTVPAELLAERDVWQCRARANDGTATGDWSSGAITLAVDRCDVEECFDGCGDGDIDPGEICDDGDENSDTRPDACRTSCCAVRVSLVERDLGDLEYLPPDNIDFIYVEYSVDGGPRQLVSNWNDRGRTNYTLVGDTPTDADWGVETVVIDDLRGTSLQIWVTGGNDGADDDMAIDVVFVTPL